jgi:hypothetical protein
LSASPARLGGPDVSSLPAGPPRGGQQLKWAGEANPTKIIGAFSFTHHAGERYRRVLVVLLT